MITMSETMNAIVISSFGGPEVLTYQIVPKPVPTAGEVPGWQVVYVDSAETLATKLALADERGLAGAGFWAIGYERGIPEMTALIGRFARGRLAD